MIQNYKTLQYSVNTITNKLENSRKSQVQKIYSSPEYIFLRIRFSGETIILALGRGAGHEGVFEAENFPTAQERIKDEFTEFLRKHLINLSLISIQMNPMDRCCRLEFITRDSKVFLYLFWKSRKLYFALSLIDPSGDNKTFLPWINSWKSITSTDLVDVFDSIGTRDIRDNKFQINHEKYRLQNSYLEKIRKTRHKKVQTKKLKKLERKRINIIKDIDTIKHWKVLKEQLLADKLDLSETKFNFHNIRCSFHKSQTHFQRKDKLFNKVKNLQKVEPFMRKRLENVERIIQKEVSAEKKVLNPRVIFPVWSRTKSQDKNVQVDPNNHTIYSIKDLKIAIGNNSQGNDYLRNSWCKKGYWFHIKDQSSAHIYVRTKYKSDLTDQVLQVIALLLRDKSAPGQTEVNLIFTDVKNIKGLKGARGSVTFNSAEERKILVQEQARKLLRSVQDEPS